MSGSWILLGSHFSSCGRIIEGLLGIESMSLHFRLRISPFRIPVVGARIRNAFSSRSSFFLADADHCNDFFGLRKSVPAWGFLLLRDNAHRVLVVFLEANGIVEDAAEDGPALVDARCGQASSRRSPGSYGLRPE